MFLIFEVVSVFLVAIAMSMAVAHAPERPGKMRLRWENHIAARILHRNGEAWVAQERRGNLSVLWFKRREWSFPVWLRQLNLDP